MHDEEVAKEEAQAGEDDEKALRTVDTKVSKFTQEGGLFDLSDIRVPTWLSKLRQRPLDETSWRCCSPSRCVC